MQFWEAVVLIVLIGSIVRVMQMRYQSHGARPNEDAALLASREEVRDLKERIQVLERVITDNHGSRRLDDEIERLRDR